MKLVLILSLFLIKLEFSLQCVPYFATINCMCYNATVNCSGNQTDTAEIKDIFLNITDTYPEYLSSVVLNVKNLEFEKNFTFENMNIVNLSIHHGLHTLPSDLFSGLSSSLKFLNLQSNYIHEVSNQSFSSLFHLTELLLDFNMLTKLRSDIFIDLNNVEFLSISGNRLKELPFDVFQYLPALKTLILNDNSFASISKINAHSLTLIELQAQNCSIYGDLEKDSLSEMPHLMHVDFSNNDIIKVMPHSLQKLKKLQFLNLSYNHIELLEKNAFSDLQNLTVLDLKNNNISEIRETAFYGLENLKVLDLSENQLTHLICDYTSDMISLEKFLLQNNKLKEIQFGAFFYSLNLTYLNLQDNNFECSCSFSKFIDYLLHNSSVKHYDFSSVNCTKFSKNFLAVEYMQVNCSLEDDLLVDESLCQSNVLQPVEEPEYENGESTPSRPSTSVTTLSTSVTFEFDSNNDSSTVSNMTISSLIAETSAEITSVSLNDTTLSSNSEASSFETTTFSTQETAINVSLTTITNGTTYIDEQTTNTDATTNFTNSFNISDIVETDSFKELNFSDIVTTEMITRKSSEDFVTKCNFTVTVNEFLCEEKKMCLKWNVSETIPSKTRCFIRYYTRYSGTTGNVVQCPKHVNDIQTSPLERDDFFAVCIAVGNSNCKFCVKKTFKSTTYIDSASYPAVDITVSYGIPELTIKPGPTSTLLPLEETTQLSDSTESVPVFAFINTTLQSITTEFTSSFLSTSVVVTDNGIKTSAARELNKDYLNSSIIPLLCLLAIILLVVIIIVYKNICKKKLESNKYEVHSEEKKVKRRTSRQDTSSSRCSYIAREAVNV